MSKPQPATECTRPGGGGAGCVLGGDRSPKSAADTTLSPKDPTLEEKKKKKSPPVIVKICINGKELTRSRAIRSDRLNVSSNVDCQAELLAG